MTRDQTRGVIAFIAIGSLISGAAQYFLGSPSQQSLQVIQEQLIEARSSLAASPVGFASPDPDEELKRFEVVSRRARELGLAARDAETLLSGVHRIAEASGVHVETIRPAESTKATTGEPTHATAQEKLSPDASLVCEIAMRGDFKGIIRFIDRLNELGWHRVNRVRIVPTGSDGPHTTEARIELVLFDFVPPNPETALASPDGHAEAQATP